MMLQHWQQWPHRVALESRSGNLTYAELNERVNQVADWLTTQPAQRLALLAENSAEWIICDLACQRANKLLVPVPPYFSTSQRQHLLAEAGIELIITDQPALIDDSHITTSPFNLLYALLRDNSEIPEIPTGTGKVTFTSGSTGNPKGVCLSNASQARVAASLDAALAMPYVRHQCLLPLATLLENIAGVYAPLNCGGTVVVCGSEELGFSGARLTDPAAMLSAISKAQPESLILVPELLFMLVTACSNGWQPPQSLRFMAVGGAHVPAGLIAKAREAGLPVYQGYGLSECVSVNTLNLPDYARLQAWQTLPEIAADAGLFTANGKLKRQQAVTHFQTVIDTMYTPAVA